LEDELYGDNNNADVLVEVSRIMHRQISWQQFPPQTKLVYRYYRLFSEPAIDAACRKVVGLSVDSLYHHGILSYANLVSAPALRIEDSTTRDAEAFLEFFARSPEELRALIHAVHRLDHAYAYQVGPIRQFPLIDLEHENGRLVLCPLPTLLFWRLTSGLYYDLIKDDPDFGQALGASFERYVGEVLSRVLTAPGLRHVGEAKYGTKQRPKATCDWLLIEGDTAAAFIECKIKRITVAAKTAMGDLKPLEDELGKLADAIIQLYERLRDYAAGSFPNLAYLPGRKCYPVVVTLEEWYLFGPRVMALLRAAVESRMLVAGIELEWLERAPYSVMSCDEFEDAAQVLNTVGLSDCFEKKLSDPEMHSWPFGNYLRHQYPQEWRDRQPLFREEAETMFNRLAATTSDAAE
jgi:hypothetical protein